MESQLPAVGQSKTEYGVPAFCSGTEQDRVWSPSFLQWDRARQSMESQLPAVGQSKTEYGVPAFCSGTEHDRVWSPSFLQWDRARQSMEPQLPAVGQSKTEHGAPAACSGTEWDCHETDPSWGRYHGGRRPSSDDSLHSPTVIPPSALDKPSVMKRYHRRRTCSHASPRRSPTMVTLYDSRFVECRWWNDGWTVVT